MRAALIQTDAFLRGIGLFDADARPVRPWWWLPAIVVAFAPIYGGVMGSFRLDSPERVLQIAYSASKVPLLLLVTSLLCLPGFFVLNTVLGLRGDFRESMQAILAGQAGLSIALAALAPFTRLWYFSTPNYRAALLFNAGAFAVATIAGHIVMFRYHRPLIRRHRYHRIMVYAWVVLYAFVGIQMGWMLRPFVGSPDLSVAFFRDEPFSNAYIFVARLVVGM